MEKKDGYAEPLEPEIKTRQWQAGNLGLSYGLGMEGGKMEKRWGMGSANLTCPTTTPILSPWREKNIPERNEDSQ